MFGGFLVSSFPPGNISSVLSIFTLFSNDLSSYDSTGPDYRRIIPIPNVKIFFPKIHKGFCNTIHNWSKYNEKSKFT